MSRTNREYSACERCRKPFTHACTLHVDACVNQHTNYAGAMPYCDPCKSHNSKAFLATLSK